MGLGIKKAPGIFRRRVSITAAQLRGCGTLPIDITTYPAPNCIQNVISVISVGKNGPGPVEFAFTSPLILHSLAHPLLGGFALDQIFINDLAGYPNMKFSQYTELGVSYENVPIYRGAKWLLTTLDSSNSAVGDGLVDLIVHYTIERTNQ